MQTKIIGLLLPIILILHNIEEYRSFDEFKTFYLKKMNPKLLHRKVFGYALILLTLFVSALCISNYLMNRPLLQFATTLVALSLLINGMHHCISSLRMRKMLPGTLSSIFLFIPCTVVYLIYLERETPFGLFDLVRWSILSMILMFVAIRLSLWTGYLFFKESR